MRRFIMYKYIDEYGNTEFYVQSFDTLSEYQKTGTQRAVLEYIYRSVDCEELIETSHKALENIKDPKIAAMCAITGLTIGESNEYVSSIFTDKDVVDLNYGDSVFLIAPTGSGKSEAIERISMQLLNNRKIKILTNRKMNSIQLLKEFREKFGFSNLTDDLLEEVTMHSNLEVMTYQKFISNSQKYQHEQFLLILDECHCLTEDSAFSLYCQKMLQFIYYNLDNTIRIYITATPNDVINSLWKIEAKSDNPLPILSMDTNLCNLINFKIKSETRIKHFYMMKPNWEYITFKVYNPNNKEQLVEYINKKLEDNIKSFIFINDKNKGSDLKEALPSSQHIYSSEDKISELSQIAINSNFEANTLIATKVAENGLSLHDDKLGLIVAETWELQTLQQVIGRARVGRKNPREIEVLIPDYSASDLGTIKRHIISQLKEFENVKSNPDYAMQYAPQNNPYIYYSAIHKRPVVNEIGYNTLQTQLDYIQKLKKEELEVPHAFLRSVLSLYDKDTEITDEMYINYNQLTDCKSRIEKAWNNYKMSLKDENALAKLKEDLKSACNETNAYGKVFKSNIQIQTVNDILKFAGIKEYVESERKVFNVIPMDIENYDEYC